MLGTLIALLLLAAALALWSQARASAELARSHALQACRVAEVQLLDATVALSALALRRDTDGWLRLERRYVFDYSRDGSDRYRGGLALLGRRLRWLAAPEPERASAAPISG